MSDPAAPTVPSGNPAPGTHAPHGAASDRPLTIAFLGNPNTGKSTLFNALAGLRTRVGNFPGCTVEKKVGRVTWEGRAIDLVDLPGTYSLSPRSLDEMVSVDVLLGRQEDLPPPDAVVLIVDASNLERNLYLASQVLDAGLPVVVALNMVDVAAARGMTIDVPALAERLGVPVVPTQAHRREGLDELREAILRTTTHRPRMTHRLFPEDFYAECRALEGVLHAAGVRDVPAYLLERLLLDVGGHVETLFAARADGRLSGALTEARARLAERGCRVPAVEARVRYAWAKERLQGVLVRPAQRAVTTSDRIDRLLTHRFAGLLAFCAMMFVVFQAIYSWSGPLMAGIEAGQGWVAGQIASRLAPGALRSLLVDGVVAGVGGVLVFLPQIALLFLFIALLEDCGYMARAAFLMDRLMTRLGLSGKSFVPLMSSFACAVPGVMATRTIENRRDRFTTLLVAPLMSCSARLPVYLLLIGAFIPATEYLGGLVGLQGLVLFGMSSLGALVAVPTAWILKKTLFRGETPPFVMELPSYKWPSPRIVLSRVYDRAKAFVVRAGTLIFATSIVVWASGYFPGDHSEQHRVQAEAESFAEEHREALEAREELRTQRERLTAILDSEAEESARVTARAAAVEEGLVSVATKQEVGTKLESLAPRLAELDRELAPYDERKERLNALGGDLLAGSVLGRAGHAIEPLVRPLGWDWRIGIGAIASFPAREVIIATLGTIYSLGGEVDEANPELKEQLRQAKWPDGRPVYGVPVALSLMVFFALCAQCAATLMTIQRETNSWRWPLFTFGYMTTLAYVAALVTYQTAVRW